MIYGVTEISNGVASMSSETYYDMSRRSGELLDAENKSSARISELESESAKMKVSVEHWKHEVGKLHTAAEGAERKLESLGYELVDGEWVAQDNAKPAQPEKFESHRPEYPNQTYASQAMKFHEEEENRERAENDATDKAPVNKVNWQERALKQEKRVKTLIEMNKDLLEDYGQLVTETIGK